MKYLYPIILIIASFAAAITFPCWWVGLICFIVAYHAFNLINCYERRIKGMQYKGRIN